MLLKAVEQSDENIGKNVHAVIWAGPYSTCGIAEISNSEHDLLSLQDLRHLLEFLSAFMGLGAHGHMFCSVL